MFIDYSFYSLFTAFKCGGSCKDCFNYQGRNHIINYEASERRRGHTMGLPECFL